MTAWQDQQPPSRRQVRMNERGVTADVPPLLAPAQSEPTTFEQFSSGPTPPPEPPVGSAPAQDQARFDTSHLGASAAQAPNGGAPLGRRAQRAAEAQPSASDAADAQAWRSRDFRPREAADVRGQSFTTTQPVTPIAPGQFDASFPTVEAEEPPSFLPSTPPAGTAQQSTIDLDYQTQSRPDAAPPQSFAAPAPAPAPEPAPAPAAPTPAAEAPQTPPATVGLSRRELRALEAARLAQQASAPSQTPAPAQPRTESPVYDISSAAPPAQPTSSQTPPPLVEPEAPQVSSFSPSTPFPTIPPHEEQVSDRPAPATGGFDLAPPTDARPIENLAPAPSNLSGVPVDMPPPRPEQLTAPVFDLPAPTAPAAFRPEEPPVDDAQASAAKALFNLAPPSGEAVSLKPGERMPLEDLPAPTGPIVWADSVVSTPERGIDDAPQLFTTPPIDWGQDDLVNSAGPTIAADHPGEFPTTTGAITTNALVLPTMPSNSDLTSPFNTATGEVIITGSISLPSSMGTTGAHPSRYDHSDLDAIIEAVDRDDIEGDSAPVRAIKAVSTHTSSRDLIGHSKKSTGSKAPVILAITAGTMMVSVTVLIVVGFVFGTF